MTVPIDHIGLIKSNSKEINSASMPATKVYKQKIRSSRFGLKANNCLSNMNMSQF